MSAEFFFKVCVNMRWVDCYFMDIANIYAYCICSWNESIHHSGAPVEILFGNSVPFWVWVWFWVRWMHANWIMCPSICWMAANGWIYEYKCMRTEFVPVMHIAFKHISIIKYGRTRARIFWLPASKSRLINR